MSTEPRDLDTVIGRTLAIDIEAPDGTIKALAKVDTGAYLGAIWATDVKEENETLYFKLFGPSSSRFTDQIITTNDYYQTIVENSFGQSERRFVVRLAIKPSLGQAEYVRTRFSLCDRSMKRYPILLGRNYLRGRFLVDVRLNDEDHIIVDEEQAATKVDEEEV